MTAFEEGCERQKHKICSKNKISADAIFLIVLSDDRGRSHQDNSKLSSHHGGLHVYEVGSGSTISWNICFLQLQDSKQGCCL